MASKKTALTPQQIAERCGGAVSTILCNIDVKAAVKKYMRMKGRVHQRQVFADYIKETQPDADDIVALDEVEFIEDAKVLVDSILSEMEKYAKP